MTTERITKAAEEWAREQFAEYELSEQVIELIALQESAGILGYHAGAADRKAVIAELREELKQVFLVEEDKLTTWLAVSEILTKKEQES